MCFMLVLLFAIAHTLHLTGMANTTTTFAVLWMVVRCGELIDRYGGNWYVLVLCLSAAAWRASLWLSANPTFIFSMFGM